VELSARLQRNLLAGVAIATALTAALTIVLARTIDLAGPARPAIFRYLFARDEPAAAWLALALLAASLAAAFASGRVYDRLVMQVASRPWPFIGTVTAGLVAFALLVYRAHPLSMDEYAAVFQAQVFARFRLHGEVPPGLVDRFIPPAKFWFIEAKPSGELISAYLPSFSLMLAPFAAAGVPWLLNPLIGGATLAAIWRLARLLWPDTAAPGWAVLLAAASPQFTVNAMSYYSMPAHLLASVLFAIAMLEDRLFTAGVIGSIALTLHNPLPHALFAVPWIASVAARPPRLRKLARLAAGYLPLSLLLGAGWYALRSGFGPQQAGPAAAAGLSKFTALLRTAFTWPSAQLAVARLESVCELSQWAVPGLLFIAIAAAWRFRARGAARLLALSAVTTFAGYFFVPYDQGHGWGFRYLHAAWAALPILAAGLLVQGGARLRNMACALAAGSLAICTPQRLLQVRGFIEGQLGQIPSPPERPALELVLVRISRGYYSVDLVQNDPFLDSDRWMMFSRGPAEDERFLQAAFPGARKVAESPVATVWRLK